MNKVNAEEDAIREAKLLTRLHLDANNATIDWIAEHITVGLLIMGHYRTG